MSDGHINIDTKIDETGLDKGLGSVDKKLKGVEKTTGSTAKSFVNLGLKVAGAAAAVKVAADVVNDLTNAYKTQIKAETQLEAAARNNPFLNSTSVQALKNYASEIQSYTTYGDEELIPMMAKLAAAGRTQDEIMQVMAAAADMAASGAFTLESAVNNLNKSYGGLSGELGESIPEIKALTAEQLKNGEAVKLLAGRYKGIAEQVAKTTGTADQLKNAFGDLKEELGAPFEKALAPARSFFTQLISGWANAKKAKREFEEGREEVQAGRGSLDQIAGQVMAAESEVERLKKLLSPEEIAKSTSHMSDAMASSYLSNLEAQLREANALVTKYTIQFSKEQQRLAEEEASKKKTVDELTLAAAEKKRNEDAAAHIAKVTAQREKDIEAIDLQAQAEGKQSDTQEILNAYTASYVSLITESNGLITAQNPAAVALLATIQQMATAIQAQAQAEKDAITAKEKTIQADKDAQEAAKEREMQEKETTDKITGVIMDSLSDRELIALQMANMEAEYEQLSADKKLEIENDYMNAWWILKKKQQQLIADDAKYKKQKEVETATAVLSNLNSFASQYASTTNDLTELIKESLNTELQTRLANIKASTMSEEDKSEAILKAESETANEIYKLNMWKWSADLLSATANTALGITQALAAGGPLGIITGALVGAAGAVQLATIIGNKPIPPAFETGGFLPGNSYSGDKLLFRGNSGEAILNASQQRQFMDIANGKAGTNIKIYNSVSNMADARAQVTEDGINVIIDKRVSTALAQGKYNRSLGQAQNLSGGRRYI
jgi:hypothetical protein